MRLRKVPVLVLCVCAVALAACESGTRRATVDRHNQVLVQQGQAIYQSQCARCHGANLEGQPDWRIRKPNGRLPAPPHDDSGHTWHHPTGMLIEIVKHGLVPPNAPEGYESDMPAYEHVLNDEQIVAVLSYIQSRWSASVHTFRVDNKLETAR
jgi:mono/diheme cytochrome c family protein